jgi:hypothetical protein
MQKPVIGWLLLHYCQHFCEQGWQDFQLRGAGKAIARHGDRSFHLIPMDAQSACSYGRETLFLCSISNMETRRCEVIRNQHKAFTERLKKNDGLT